MASTASYPITGASVLQHGGGVLAQVVHGRCPPERHGADGDGGHGLADPGPLDGDREDGPVGPLVGARLQLVQEARGEGQPRQEHDRPGHGSHMEGSGTKECTTYKYGLVPSRHIGHTQKIPHRA